MLRFFLAALLLLLPAQALALCGGWVQDDAVAARLISSSDAVGTNATVPLGLELELKDGWHTYWRSPGEAGLPPQLDWNRSQNDANNLQSATLLYPAPRRYTAFGMETIGYRDHVIFPIDAVLRKAGQGLNAEVSADILVCSSMCVPKHFDLKLTVPAGAARDSAEADLLRQARAKVPTDSKSSGIFLKNITSDGQSLTLSIASREAMTQPDVFVENDKEIGFSAPEVTLAPSGTEATLKIKPLDKLPAGVTLDKLPLTLTITSGDRAVEIKNVLVSKQADSLSPLLGGEGQDEGGGGEYKPAAPLTPTPLPPSGGRGASATLFFPAFLFALLGGFILNLMPCVLPVLSLKIVSLVGHGGGETRRVRQSFLMTAAGILFSFLSLAGIMAALKNLGGEIGWGVQFQQPVFLMFLVLLLTFFAANLWGLFEIPLPRFLADTLDSAWHPKLAGDFATGAFATLLATPCSAPFLGTAIGFALASGGWDIVAIFAGLGLGMSLPYLAIAAFPRAATMLPKPGRWMLWLRRFLGVALALTAMWLIGILAAQITTAYALSFGFLMIAIELLLALRKRGMSRERVLSCLAALCFAALAMGISGANMPKAQPQTDGAWVKFDEAALNADIAEGKTVFLDVTADWCLTCKANKTFVLSKPEIALRLFHSDAVAMQADWTNPDPVVIKLLHQYGRYGIPFNIVFGPKAKQGIVLPELLTREDVLKALDKASNTTMR
ncbi:MAG: protein-disulfide reductase DsbD family protein [Alphaproteobacteria bacterium]|nr:protein-disulfide reductase DsbD family protein [Alphaproteobacteria bacterium]